MIELLLCVAIALFLATQPELRALLRRLDPGHRVFLGAFLGSMLLGQLVDDGKRSFPFVPWNMYDQRAVGDPFFHQYQLLRASGRRQSLSGSGPDPAISPQMQQRLQELEGSGAHDTDRVRSDAAAELDAILRSLAVARARDVPDDPPVALEIWRATVQLHDPRSPTDVHVELERRIELP
jgi:hypothetical protein